MQVNESAPVIVSCAIEIDAEVEVIWDVLTSIEDWPDWNPKVQNATLIEEIREGAEFHWKAGLASISSTIESIDRPRSISWTGKTFGVTAFHRYDLQTLAKGTLVTTVESWDGPLIGLLRVPIRKMLRESLEAGLTHLKAESERRAATVLSR